MAKDFIDPLRNPVDDNILKYNSIDTSNNKEKNKNFKFENLDKILAGNRIFTKDGIDWYNKFSRYGYIDPYNTEQVSTEYLFFTKPDLNLFKENTYGSDLNNDLAKIPFFAEANKRHKNALRQLEYSVPDVHGAKNPFMYLLSNSVTSKLDLPNITAEFKDSTPNIMGTSIQYRSHSFKSDIGYDFSLSFTDTAYLEVYTLLKAYDEYMRMVKIGELSPKKKYIKSRILSEQFSIYKFLIGSDGETILFYSKLTGCYFTDVPRGDFSDPGPDGFKFSASFHAQFVEDNNPLILAEFNRLVKPLIKSDAKYANIYDFANNVVDNTWVRWPVIVRVHKDNDKQVTRRKTTYDYRIKWVK